MSEFHRLCSAAASLARLGRHSVARETLVRAAEYCDHTYAQLEILDYSRRIVDACEALFVRKDQP